MKTEITIRFNDAATANRFTDTILIEAERQTISWLCGGFYFTTERDAFAFMADIASEGFCLNDFDSIEFKNA
jgi:hypothetical protein